MNALRALCLVMLAVSAAALPAAGEEPVKLPPGVKLPPQPHEWIAPSFDMTPPSAEARWEGTWKRGRALPLPLAAHCAVADGQFIYVMGGVSGRDHLGQRDVWMSRSGEDGGLGKWKKARALPVPTAFGGAVLAGGRVYILGGSSREVLQNLYDKVCSAPLKGGSLGAWREERAMPSKLLYHAVAACGGFVYVLGGFNGNEYSRDLLYAKLNPDGSLGEWAKAKGRYPHPIGKTFMTVVGGDLVVAGGMWNDSQGEHVTSLIMRGKCAPDGDVTEWVSEDGIKVAARPLKFSLAEQAGASDANFAYMFGGRDSFSPGLATTQASWINPVKGHLTRWQFGPELPLFGVRGAPQGARLYQTAAVIAGDYVYVLGGFLYIREPTAEVLVQRLKPYQEPSWLKSKKR
jgi:hypothetical protein